jgi:hypothetical protein
VSKRRLEPQLLRIKENAIYVRTIRTYHAVKRRHAANRLMHAIDLQRHRDACWQSYRQLVEIREHVPQGSPWAFYSCRPGVKMAE